MEQGLITRTRRTFDKALCALPITQHERIWPLYLVRTLSSWGILLDRLHLHCVGGCVGGCHQCSQP